ncbi:amidohydrolase [Bacillus mycoides]|uniref:M20 metallopeptidase family protein n=1 Tax=Bacillus mycoides TaxID=1405 RepID=UPI00103B0E36|nr:M20 family metallopeptidase [Bacillus mycoides]QWG34692.1 amidohydrolase [Bacillus mycoides]TBX80547.1 amidohydrolase [Bacillus mycoides]
MIETWHKELESLYNQMVSWRRDFHQYPELSFQEIETPKKIAEILKSFHIDVKTDVGGRGVIGLIEGGIPGKTIALRADFDGLPIQDEKQVSYKSKIPGVMHACGHDGHTATLLGVAKILSENRDQLSGKIVLIHQHAEEKEPGGAIAMIEDGCLEGVDVVFGTHLSSQMPVGIVGAKAGEMMAAADTFEVKIQGRGGHGGMPHHTVDAIIVATQVINQLQLLVSRKVDPLQSAVLTVGTFHAGQADNIIADTATFTGTIRTLNPEVREFMEKEFKRVVEGICQSLHAEVNIQYKRGYPILINHLDETSHFMEIAKRDLGRDRVIEVTPIMGGEDFAYYLEHVPGAFFFTGAGNEEIGATYQHHHPQFDFDERAMLVGGKLLLSLVNSYLRDGKESLKTLDVNTTK